MFIYNYTDKNLNDACKVIKIVIIQKVNCAHNIFLAFTELYASIQLTISELLKEPLYQSEVRCTTFHMKMVSFTCKKKTIFI